jgi:ribosomal protein L22
MEVKAEARYIRVSPQKARLVVDLIRGRKANDAIITLRTVNKRIAPASRRCCIGHRQRAEPERRRGRGST